MTDALSRRQFLGISVAAGTGLVLGVHLPSPAEAGDSALAPNAFVRVGLDGAVTVVVKHLEMGQGVNTGLPAIVAEELAVPWRSIRVEAAPADAARYNNLLFGRMQGTGGSTATANSYDQLRKAAAAAREMLLEAAASRLKAPRAELVAEGGQVTHPPSGRAIAYGKLAADAARLTVPQDPPLKDPKDFTIIGKDGAVRRTDSRAKSDGTAQFGLDVRLPGMATAMVVRPPVFGAKLARFDDAKTRKVAGIRAVFAIPSGIAVVADDTWSALKGRDALVVEWQDGEGAALSSDGIRAEFTKLVKTPGLPARADGDVEAVLAGDGRKVAATYEVPYLAHAPMEPLNCVVRLAKDKCEIWTGCQFHTVDQAQAARVAGLKPEQVEIHTLFAGGSFGRRANTGSDYIVEAVEVAKRIDGPVRLMWTREDDITGGLYRGCFVHGLEAAIDETGAPIGWHHRLAGQSIAAGTPMEASMVKDGIDHASVEGASTLPYAIPNLRVELHSPTLAVPVLWWRSVGSSHNAFVTECFLDEVAHLGGRDPLELRRALLAQKPRSLAVLELAAAKAGWGTPLPQGRGRGIAVHESFHTIVAEVAEITVDSDNNFKVDRVVCAIDCGLAVTPDVIRAQMEGGIAFGLSAALFGAITITEGRAHQDNFDGYRLLKMSEMPVVEVHIMPSAEPPTGVGEPGVPPIAPAVGNALFAATGKRLRRLPFGEQLKGA